MDIERVLAVSQQIAAAEKGGTLIQYITNADEVEVKAVLRYCIDEAVSRQLYEQASIIKDKLRVFTEIKDNIRKGLVLAGNDKMMYMVGLN